MNGLCGLTVEDDHRFPHANVDRRCDCKGSIHLSIHRVNQFLLKRDGEGQDACGMRQTDLNGQALRSLSESDKLG